MKKLLKTSLLLLTGLLCACGNEVTSSIGSNTTSSDNGSSSTSTTTSVVTSTPSSPEEYTKITISDFLKYKNTSKYYILEGEITNLTDNRYGNFDLKDSTGSIFVYGLLENKGATDKMWFTNSGLKEGDTITLAGKYLNYYGKHEVDGAYFISKSSSSNTGGNDSSNKDYAYTDFTSSEKALFNQKIGFVIPFAPSNEYYIDDYPEEGIINYYALDMTTSDFNNYKALCDNKYTYDGKENYDGITCYLYSNDESYFDISYWECEFLDGSTSYIIDVYCYYEPTSTDEPSTPEDSQLITNDGKGLPSSSTGIYNADFTKASPLKDVHDQGYYLGGCPTTGNVNVLVIPVQFNDSLAENKGYSLETIDKAFNDTSDKTKPYPSVKEYYYTSSYGQLNLTFDVLDSWYTASQNSTYYINLDKTNTSSYVTSEQYILEEALTSLDGQIDFSKYDLDNNDSIDAIVMINTLDINYDNDLQWAFRYWNMYFDEYDYFLHDNKYANDYLWASYQFLCESSTGYNNKNADNTYTYIHEFGHILGADDYYDSSYSDQTDIGLRDHDIMDSEFGDHNPYSKFNYGWITSSRVVTTNTSITVDLEDFSVDGDTIIIGNNFDPDMGIYQEYYVLMYYTNNGLNAPSNAGYFDEEGILMYHINASYYVEEYYGETYYDVYNNNIISGEYASENMLIEYVKNGNDFIYGVNDSSSKNIVDDNGDILKYSFKVNSLSSGVANLTITKN